MPKMFIHAPEGTFDPSSREKLATSLTELGLACEALPNTAFVRSTVWIYFNDYAADALFMGGKPATAKVISLVVYALEGGLDAGGKKRLIEGATDLLGQHAGLSGRIPAYVAIREVPEANWGIFGTEGNLAALRASSFDIPAL